jgi:hypothetical protein
MLSPESLSKAPSCQRPSTDSVSIIVSVDFTIPTLSRCREKTPKDSAGHEITFASPVQAFGSPRAGS